MANAAGVEPNGPALSLCALAGTLTEMARRLAAAMPNVAEDDVRVKLTDSLEGIRAVSTSLRSIDLLYDPEHARHFVRHGEHLRRLAMDMSEIVGDLTVANRQASTRLDEHIQNLERIAEESGGDVGDRLQATVTRAREMATDMFQTFGTITSKVSIAAERVARMESELAEAREKALVDALTRIHSRAALDARLEAKVAEGRAAKPWCLLLMAVDGFRHVIENRGAIVGDALLFKVARTLEVAVKAEEGRSFLARYADEEFALLLEAARLGEGRNVGELIRRGVAESRWEERDKPDQGIVSTTVSVGLTQYREGDTVAGLVRRAELALRDAQRAGRNRVVAV